MRACMIVDEHDAKDEDDIRRQRKLVEDDERAAPTRSTWCCHLTWQTRAMQISGDSRSCKLARGPSSLPWAYSWT